MTATTCPPARNWVCRRSDRATRGDARYTLDLLADMSFIVDIVLNFRTAYRKTGGQVVTDPVLIRHNYATTWYEIVDSRSAIDGFVIIVRSLAQRARAQRRLYVRQSACAAERVHGGASRWLVAMERTAAQRSLVRCAIVLAPPRVLTPPPPPPPPRSLASAGSQSTASRRSRSRSSTSR